MQIDLQTLAQRLGGEISNGQVLAPGPGHSTKDRSMAVKIDSGAPDGFLVNSFSGDDPIACKDFVRQRLGLPAFKPNGRQRASDESRIERALMAAMAVPPSNKPKAKIVATYDYVDADGKLLYQVCRTEPKSFRQRRPDGNGGWVWKLDEQRVLYRLPQLLEFPDGTIFITEGEKDADRLTELGHCSTTVASGRWTSTCTEALKARDVVILQDNDIAGKKKALEAARALHGIANSIVSSRYQICPPAATSAIG